MIYKTLREPNYTKQSFMTFLIIEIRQQNRSLQALEKNSRQMQLREYGHKSQNVISRKPIELLKNFILINSTKHKGLR